MWSLMFGMLGGLDFVLDREEEDLQVLVDVVEAVEEVEPDVVELLAVVEAVEPLVEAVVDPDALAVGVVDALAAPPVRVNCWL